MRAVKVLSDDLLSHAFECGIALFSWWILVCCTVTRFDDVHIANGISPLFLKVLQL